MGLFWGNFWSFLIKRLLSLKMAIFSQKLPLKWLETVKINYSIKWSCVPLFNEYLNDHNIFRSDSTSITHIYEWNSLINSLIIQKFSKQQKLVRLDRRLIINNIVRDSLGCLSLYNIENIVCFFNITQYYQISNRYWNMLNSITWILLNCQIHFTIAKYQ